MYKRCRHWVSVQVLLRRRTVQQHLQQKHSHCWTGLTVPRQTVCRRRCSRQGSSWHSVSMKRYAAPREVQAAVAPLICPPAVNDAAGPVPAVNDAAGPVPACLAAVFPYHHTCTCISFALCLVLVLHASTPGPVSLKWLYTLWGDRTHLKGPTLSSTRPPLPLTPLHPPTHAVCALAGHCNIRPHYQGMAWSSGRTHAAWPCTHVCG